MFVALFVASLVLVLLILLVLIDLDFLVTRKWCKSQKCLFGKTAIITGSNSGIGYQIALDFAKRGARVILACRNRQKAEEARDRIIKETGNGNVVVKMIDMSSFKSVRAFAKDVNETEDRLDILVNNAATVETEDKKSEDGHLLIYQVNYLSIFLLTHLLLGLLKKNKESRIINIASLGAKFALNFDVDNFEKYNRHFMGYCISKLCLILFTTELARKLEGTGVSTYSLHPGPINTPMVNSMLYDFLIRRLVSLFLKTPKAGAQTAIYCALTPGIEKYSGGFFQNCQKLPFFYSINRSKTLSKKLWEKSAKIVQLTPEDIS